VAEEPSERVCWGELLKRVIRRTRGHDSDDLLPGDDLRLELCRTEHAVENPRAFLVRAASNIALDNHQHERLRASDSETREDQRSNNDVRLQDEVIAARARLARVNEGLAKLPPRMREIFLMHRLDGMNYREIAVHFGISQSAVEKQIAKAVLFLSGWTRDW
jgi:RNA polymerase sigma factor (sigma-70 family)